MESQSGKGRLDQHFCVRPVATLAEYRQALWEQALYEELSAKWEELSAAKTKGEDLEDLVSWFAECSKDCQLGDRNILLGKCACGVRKWSGKVIRYSQSTIKIISDLS